MLWKRPEALINHAALEARGSLKALADKSIRLVNNQISLISSHRSQLAETLDKHNAGQVQDEHLGTLTSMENKMKSEAMSEQLEAQTQQLRESKAALQAGTQAESLVAALKTGQTTLQSALRTQQESLGDLQLGIAGAMAKRCRLRTGLRHLSHHCRMHQIACRRRKKAVKF